ncbi:MAG: flagellin [Peptococcaceae bacterium]
MRINHNIAALNTHRQLTMGTSAASKSMEKLSSGLRINRAGDDAAGLAISEKMRGQIRGLDQASRNSQDGISMIQTAEGALNETHSILQRMRELAVQASTDTNTAGDRVNIQDEMDQLTEELTRIANTTEFNTMKLLDGSKGGAVTGDVANVQTNSSLGTIASDAVLLTNLKDNAGASLGIEDGDTVSISYVKNGSTETVTVAVTAGTALSALTDGNITTTVSGADNSLIFTAATSGYAGAINGLTITVESSDGEVKTAATNALSAFEETTAAQDSRLDGTAKLQIGANEGQSIDLSIENMSAAALGVKGLKVGTQLQASVAINAIDAATVKVSAERSKLGSVQNRLEHTINNLDTASENLQAAESRVRDVDMAKEMMEYTKNNILTQASQAMLAQANQTPQGVLQLLQ